MTFSPWYLQLIRRVGWRVFWMSIISLSVLLIHNAMLYFTHGGEYGILPEKQLARQDWLWNLCFYVHLPAGSLCLALPWVSFGRGFGVLRKMHAVIGKSYTWITVLIVCPTGIYLGIYAKGGTITIAGFMLQGILLAIYTVRGWLCARRGDAGGHISNMIRSYSIAVVVLTFRVLHILFFVLRVPYQDNYAMSQWLGLTINLLVAELIIAVHEKRTSLKTSTI